MSKSIDTGQRGLSLVELMIGLAMSLFIIAGALKLFAGHLESSRHASADARLDQDMRAAIHIAAREIRRAGYWRTIEEGKANINSNPNGGIATAGTPSAASISYRYDSEPQNASDASIDLKGGALRLKIGNGGYQPVTDAEVITITRFTVMPHVTRVSLGDLCLPVCPITDAHCPSLQTRSYDITMAARSTTDPSLTRETHESVQVRNDELLQGTCP